MAVLPLVSVLIPTRNNADELILCLESLRDLKYPKDRMELLIFDNGSTDKTPERVQELFTQFRLEGWARLAFARSPRNLGAFGGRAEALQRALGPETDFILSLDDDVELDPNALPSLLQVMDDTRVGVVGVRVVYHDSPEEVASGAGYFNRWLGTYYHLTPASRTACDFVSSCGFLIRRTALDAVGGFDRDYFTSHGDVDICLRIRRCGYEVLYEPAAVIRHKVARGGTRSPERIYYLYRNKLLLLRKHVPWWWFPMIFTSYGTLWLPKAFVGSLAHHRRLCTAEIRAILLAMLDGAFDRRGEARWFSSSEDAESRNHTNASHFDDDLNTTLYKTAVKLKYSCDALLNLIRCHMSYTAVRCKFLLGFQAQDLLKLHLGCGDQVLKGYLNIDFRKTPATDLVCNIKKLPYPSNSVQVIETYHVIEHLPRHDLPGALREWYRVLSPGGRLIIECPDFDAVAKQYIEGNEERLDSIFGLQRFQGDAHLFGYNFTRLKNLLQHVGFAAIERSDARDYHATHEPCLRVEAIKEPGN